ncbi:nuclease-related domain-containing protein [Neobacillus drentensis]
MALKSRSESVVLKIMRSLNTRSNLSTKEKKYYFKLEKGYQGELMFDKLTEKLQSDMLVINDLCFEFNDNIFQIDTLIIAQSTIYPFEVKITPEIIFTILKGSIKYPGLISLIP